MDDFDNETENSINDEDDADDMWNDINWLWIWFNYIMIIMNMNKTSKPFSLW
jgi:hypothetical protein